MANDGPEWFAPKRVGYGAGLPIAWQGWLVLGLFMAGTLWATIALGKRPMTLLGVIVPLVVVMLVITAKTTRGGWRWRSGREQD